MDRLAKTELFSLLSESSKPVTNEEMKNAYEDFVKKTLTLNQSEIDYQIIYRSLSFARIEFASSQLLLQYEQEKKCA